MIRHFQRYLVYYLVVVSLVVPSVRAETTVNNPATPAVLSTTVTPQWIDKQQKLIEKARAALEKERLTWKTEEKTFPKKLEEMDKAAQSVTEDLLKPAVEAKEAASGPVEKLHSERQLTKDHLEKLQQVLQEQQKKLDSLLAKPPTDTPAKSSSSPTENLPAPAEQHAKKREKTTSPGKQDNARAETAKAQPPKDEVKDKPDHALAEPAVKPEPTPEELKGNIALLQSAIEIQKQYLKLLDEQYQIASQHLKLAIQWHDKLQTSVQMRQLTAKQEAIKNAKAELAKSQESFQFLQKELPNQIARLETAQITADALKEMLEKVALDKETKAIEIDNLKLENQGAEANLAKQKTDIEDQRKKLETLRKTALPADDQRREIKTLGLPMSLQVRFVRVVLPNGEFEVLVTSLLDEMQFPTSAVGELYHLRWGVETLSGVVKTRLQLEHFSGLTVESVRQDFYATIFITNLESVLTEEATVQLEKKTSKNLHPQQVNQAVSFKAIKNYVIALFYLENSSEEILKQLTQLFLTNPSSVRPQRSVPRHQRSPTQRLNYHRRVKRFVFKDNFS
jgi:hypothetical protein